LPPRKDRQPPGPIRPGVAAQQLGRGRLRRRWVSTASPITALEPADRTLPALNVEAGRRVGVTDPPSCCGPGSWPAPGTGRAPLARWAVGGVSVDPRRNVRLTASQDSAGMTPEVPSPIVDDGCHGAQRFDRGDPLRIVGGTLQSSRSSGASASAEGASSRPSRRGMDRTGGEGRRSRDGTGGSADPLLVPLAASLVRIRLADGRALRYPDGRAVVSGGTSAPPSAPAVVFLPPLMGWQNLGWPRERSYPRAGREPPLAGCRQI